MNKNYRKKDKPTNVLSFATLENDPFIHPEAFFHIGDVVLALETLKKEAEEQSKRLEDHFMHLLIHGILHLLGYDHIKKEDAKVMENLEIQILNTFGIENPYKNSDFVPE